MARGTQVLLPTDRSFGVTFAVIFVLLGAWMYTKGNSNWIATLTAAALFLLAALAFPRLLHPLNVAWMHLGRILNRVVSPVVMAVVFFGLVTPLAVVLRLRGRDVLQRSFDPACGSYWIKRDPPGPDGSSFPRQY